MRDDRLAALVSELRADPEAAFAVAVALCDIAGPWRRTGRDEWARGSATGGIAATTYGPSSARTLAFYDERLLREGRLLVGGVPTDAAAPCDRVVNMIQGRPRLVRATDPRRPLACWQPAGHPGRCRALAPMVHTAGDREHDPARSVWWNEEAL